MIKKFKSASGRVKDYNRERERNVKRTHIL